MVAIGGETVTRAAFATPPRGEAQPEITVEQRCCTEATVLIYERC
jgi:hypothetical protein